MVLYKLYCVPKYNKLSFSINFYINFPFTLCLEKRDQNVFRDIFYKTWAICMKFSA